MKRGLDTNVLVYAQMPAFEVHGEVRRFLLEQLENPDLTLVVTPGILHEFVHVVTDGRRFDPPVSMAEALAVARLFLGRSNFECVGADETILLEAFDLLERYQLGRKRIADTLLAATLLHHSISELITCNPRDFGIIEGLELIDPRIASTGVPDAGENGSGE